MNESALNQSENFRLHLRFHSLIVKFIATKKKFIDKISHAFRLVAVIAMTFK